MSGKRQDAFIRDPHYSYLLKNRKRQKIHDLARALYIFSILPYTANDSEYDVALIQPGLPYLDNFLNRQGLKTINFLYKPELIQAIESKVAKFQGQVLAAKRFSELSIPDRASAITASHNILQKLGSIEEAIDVVCESFRITADVVCHQVITGDKNPKGKKKGHTLNLSVNEWTEKVFKKALQRTGKRWKLREIHFLSPFNINIGLHPIWIFENGPHLDLKQKIELTPGLRFLTSIHPELTTANAFSILKSGIALGGVLAFRNFPLLLSFTVLVSIFFDYLDGQISRHLDKKQTFSGKNKGPWIDILTDRLNELIFSFGFASYHLLSWLIPVFFAVKGAITDPLRLYRDWLLGDYGSPLKGKVKSSFQRTGYALSKAVYFASAPLAPAVYLVRLLKQIFEIVTLSVGAYRAGQSLFDSRNVYAFLRPDAEAKHLGYVEVEFLKSKGIQGVVFDGENTLFPHGGAYRLDKRIAQSFLQIKESFQVCLLTNARDSLKDEIEKSLDIHVVKTFHKKPRQKAFQKALDYLKTDPKNTAVIGDRRSTDIAGANMMGMFSIKVNPLVRSSEPFSIKCARLAEEAIATFYRLKPSLRV